MIFNVYFDLPSFWGPFCALALGLLTLNLAAVT